MLPGVLQRRHALPAADQLEEVLLVEAELQHAPQPPKLGPVVGAPREGRAAVPLLAQGRGHRLDAREDVQVEEPLLLLLRLLLVLLTSFMRGCGCGLGFQQRQRAEVALP